MAKIYTALVAEDITTLAEQHKLLLGCHFGERPGHRTTDSMHLLVHRIKQAWQNKRVASVLFLDIEGAFPNAVKDQLLHNMRKMKVPEALVRTVRTALTGRRTVLWFDDFLSNAIPLDNGIGQGDPMSMIVYLFYNSDILEVPRTKNELAVAYVDDTALLVEGPSFDETHATLKRMMNRRGGAFEWSAEHNLRFKVSKFALVDFWRKKGIDRPPLQLRQTTIAPTPFHKFLGVIHIELLLIELCLQAITRMVSLDDEHHPLTKVVRHSFRHPVKCHPYLIHALAWLSGLRLGNVAPPPRPSLEQIKRSLFCSVIAKTQEASIEAERNDRARIKMYTDGSSTDGGVGASVALFETDQPGFIARQFHLGAAADHTSYEAELVGALMAAHLVATVPPNSTTSIYIDSQATLKAITSPPEGPGAHIIAALDDCMKIITTK